MNYLTRLKNMESPIQSGAKRATRGGKGASGPFGTSQTGAFEKNKAETPKGGISTPDCITDNWTAEDYRAFFDERVAIVEHDGALPRAEAEYSALESCVVKWLIDHPEPSDPDRCAACGKAGPVGDIVSYLAGHKGHTWLHDSCWPPWHAGRREQAVAELAKMGVPALASPDSGGAP